MKKCICAGDKYLKQINFCDVALLKFSLLSLGVFLGIQVKCPKARKAVGAASFIIFIATAIPQFKKLSACYNSEEE